MNCGPTATARDLAFLVTLPVDATSVHASVDAGAGSPILSLHNGATCNDVVATGACSAVTSTCAPADAVVPTDVPLVFMLTVGEITATANDYTVHIEVQ